MPTTQTATTPTYNLSDIVSNQTVAASATPAPASTAPGSAAAPSVPATYKLSDIVSNQTADGPATPPVEGTLSNLGSGVVDAAGKDIWGTIKNTPKGIWDSLPPVQLVDTVKQTLPLFDVYEKSRTSGASISDSIKAADDAARQHMSNISPIKQVADAFRANPTRETARALTDAAAVAASMFLPGAVEDMVAAPEAATAADAGEVAGSPGWLARNNPFRAGGRLSRAVSPTAAVQPEAQTALREGAAASATDAGVTTPVMATPGAGVRTLMVKPIAEASKIENGLYASVNKAAETDMKSLYDRQEELQDTLDDPTQIHNKAALQSELQTTQQNIAAGEAKVQSALGKNASKLISQAKAATQQRFAMEAGDAKLFNNESVVKGNVAHGSNETINVDAAIRQAEILDKPSKFAPRGTPTRLQQMFGEEGAKNFKDGLYDAQKAGQKVVTRNKVLGWVGGSGVLGALGLGYEMTK